MKLSRQSFLDLVEYLCLERPLMYTKNGTFWEIFAFIQGYALGSGVHGREGSHAGLQDFFHWLEKKNIVIEKEGNWSTLENFHAAYPNDEAALKDFARYYRDFCEELSEEEDEIKVQLTESVAYELANFLNNKKSFADVQERIKIGLWQNSNNREYLRSKEINDKK
jgi:hypothetical protein